MNETICKRIILTILIILLILNSTLLIFQFYCLAKTLKNPGPHLFEGTAADFAIHAILFSVIEVIIIIAIIRLFSKKSVQIELSYSGDKDENE